ncbi:MAG: hypothetical protein AB8B50_11435 [Pirellulaceae bacterium]
MKYKIPHFTGLAASLICIAFFLQLSTPALAIDEILKKIVSAETAKYKMQFESAGGTQEIEVLQYDGAVREKFGDQISIRDLKRKKVLVLNEKLRTASLATIKTDADLSKSSSNPFESFRSLLESEQPSNPKMLGEQEFDGKSLSGFQVQISDMTLTIWADPKTQTPVRIEYPLPGYDTSVLITGYEPNIDIDPSLFSLEVPDGYELRQTEVDAGELPTEDDLLRTLKLYSDFSGKYPESLGISGLTKTMQSYIQERMKDGQPDLQELQNQTVSFSRGFTFTMTLMAENDSQYAGADAKPGDSDTPIFWYKPSSQSKFRVIYADLSIKQADKAPQVKGAQKVGSDL